MTPSALQSLYECRHESQEQWTRWAVAMQDAWPEMYRGLSAATEPRDERARFEAWHSGWTMYGLRQRDDDSGNYTDYITQLAWQAWQAAAPRPTPPPAIEVSPKLGEAMDTIKHMVNRFLNWKLPANFRPDAGISFKADYNEHTPWPAKHEPYGTNLFDATQAEAMVRYMLEGLPYSGSAAMEARLAASTEQTEAQDDEFCTIKPVGCPGHISEPRDWCAFCKLATAKAEAVMFAEKVLDGRLERDTLRAQLEAARGERDEARAWAKIHQENSDRQSEAVFNLHVANDSLRADLAQKMHEHQDALSEMRGRIPELEGEAKAWRDAWAAVSKRYPHHRPPEMVAAAALSPPSAGAV